MRSGRLTSRTDGNGKTTLYSYDAADQLLSKTYQDGSSDTFTYDPAGNLITRTDARGATATSTYDALNRVTSTAYSLNGTTDQTISFSYDSGTDGIGHLTRASGVSESTTWGYDPVGRVTSKSETVGGTTLSVGYAYTNGDLTTLTTPSGQAVRMSYSNGQVASISVNGTTLLSGVSYEPFGPVRGWNWGRAGSVFSDTTISGRTAVHSPCGRSRSDAKTKAKPFPGVQGSRSHGRLAWREDRRRDRQAV